MEERKKSRKGLVALGVAAVVIVAAGTGFWIWHEQPSFCNAVCHTPMDSYVEAYYADDATLLATSHRVADVSCLDCHVPTLGEQLARKAGKEVLMEVLLAIVISVLFAFALRKQIKRYAVSFYIVAAAADVLFLSGVLFGVSREFAAAVYPYLTRCLLGFSLFALVMYVGALPEGSKARQMLMPIRGELSIIAAIFTIGHVANYLGTYLADILSGFAGMSAGMIASFIVSSLLIVLLAALTVTSFNTVKTRMNSDAWKRLQKTAYAFFGLTYVHLVLVLAPTVSSSGQKAAFSIAAYTAVMLVYVVLRTATHLRAKRTRPSTS